MYKWEVSEKVSEGEGLGGGRLGADISGRDEPAAVDAGDEEDSKDVEEGDEDDQQGQRRQGRGEVAAGADVHALEGVLEEDYEVVIGTYGSSDRF